MTPHIISIEEKNIVQTEDNYVQRDEMGEMQGEKLNNCVK